MVDDALAILTNPDCDIREFGQLMHEGWITKRGISNNISNDVIDQIYATARSQGAIGGKLMGAGGGGFMILFVPPERQASIKNALSDFVHVPFKFERGGSSVCVYEPQGL